MESKDEKTLIETSAELQTCGLGLSITRPAWNKLMGWCRATNLEVSGFMLLERDGDLLWIDDAYLVDQVSTGASTEMDRTAIAKFQLDLYKQGIIGAEGSKKRLAHFHTHCTFGVFWSGTDMEMRELNRRGVDYFVSLVINHKGDALAAIDINGDFPLSINNLPIEIVDDENLAAAYKAEVEAKVKEPCAREYAGYDGNYAYGQRTWGGADALPGMEDMPLSDTQLTDIRMLGPKDRRWKKNKVRVTAAGTIDKRTIHGKGNDTMTYSDWVAQREEYERALTHGPARTYLSDDAAITSDEHGTYENIGGEIVKTDDPITLD
jgi:hypothetical protein